MEACFDMDHQNPNLATGDSQRVIISHFDCGMGSAANIAILIRGFWLAVLIVCTTSFAIAVSAGFTTWGVMPVKMMM
jgi:hypothetical protein